MDRGTGNQNFRVSVHTELKAHWAVPLQQSQHAVMHILKGVSHCDNPGNRVRKRPFPSEKKNHCFGGQPALPPPPLPIHWVSYTGLV